MYWSKLPVVWVLYAFPPRVLSVMTHESQTCVPNEAGTCSTRKETDSSSNYRLSVQWFACMQIFCKFQSRAACRFILQWGHFKQRWHTVHCDGDTSYCNGVTLNCNGGILFVMGAFSITTDVLSIAVCRRVSSVAEVGAFAHKAVCCFSEESDMGSVMSLMVLCFPYWVQPASCA